MSKYKHPSGKIATKHNEFMYDVDDIPVPVPKNLIENPDFGWEKVEEFQEGTWMWRAKTSCFNEALIRYSGTNKDGRIESTEAYFLEGNILKYEFHKHEYFGNIKDYQKATPDKIERILSIVARHKGYKEGALVNSLNVTTPCELIQDGLFNYYEDTDQLYHAGIVVYSKGTWAKILPEKATEPQIEAGYEYTCVSDLAAREGIAFTKGNRYVFHKGNEYYTATNDFGRKHNLSQTAMNEYFDMGQDWKTAKVFSYEDFYSLQYSHTNYGNFVIPHQKAEEEAKKRTQL